MSESAPNLPYETLPDNLPLPQLPPGPAGGANILELQAACPFRAFAERRLFSAELETTEPGLDPRERGSLAHDVMQFFWEHLQTQQALRALPPAARVTLLDDCIRRALAAHATRHLTPFDTEYLAIQHQRLATVLLPWLDEELKRQPFTVIAMEQKLEATVGGLQLDLRVDRIDDTPGGPLILDYKTGTAATTQWESGRPEKPQLPLYAIAASPAPAGIAFASLRAGKDLALSGLATGGVIAASAPKADLPFPDRLEEWRAVLTTLATGFASGDVRVDPRKYPATCKHCGQRILCRLNPFAVDDLSDEDNPIIESAPS